MLTSARIGTTNTQIRLYSSVYGNDGSLVRETNALGGVTSYGRWTNRLGETALAKRWAAENNLSSHEWWKMQHSFRNFRPELPQIEQKRNLRALVVTGAMNDNLTKYIAIWFSKSIRSPGQLTKELTPLYKSVGLLKDSPSPRVATELENVAISELISSLSCPDRVKELAIQEARSRDVLNVTVVVMIYVPNAQGSGNSCDKIGSFERLGTFPLSDEYRDLNTQIAADQHEKWRSAEPKSAKLEDIDARDAEGESALYRACRLGQLNYVKELLDQGAGIEADNEVGHTPLMVAAATENDDLLQLLLANGADTAVVTKEEHFTALHWSVLHPCRIPEKVERIIHLLAKYGADVNAKANGGKTALMTAAYFGSSAAVSALLDVGADLMSKDDEGQTAMALAAKRRHFDVCDLLKQRSIAAKPSGQISLFSRIRSMFRGL